MILAGKILNISRMEKKIFIFMLFIFSCFGFLFSQGNTLIPFTVTVDNVAEGQGKVYIAVYATSESYKKEKPDYTFTGDGNGKSLIWETSLPEGQYLVAVFQDLNGNKKLDTKIFGIPKEPVALSEWDGKGIPKGWEEQSFYIKGGNPVDVVLALSIY